jgi:hypothetical protein
MVDEAQRHRTTFPRGIETLSNNNEEWRDATADYTVGSDVSKGDEGVYPPFTSAGDINSYFQSGVAPYVFNDMIRDLSANEEERKKNYAYAADIDWRNITHPQSYKMRDEITDRLYRSFNPYRGYTGVGGNIPVEEGNIGFDLYQNLVDERTQAELEASIPFLSGDLTAGLDWNSEEDITNWLLKFVLPFGNK